MPLTQIQQDLEQLGVRVTPQQQRLMQLSEQMARNFGERLLAGALPAPTTPAGRQFQLQMLQQALQHDPDTYAPYAQAQFRRMFPEGRTVTQDTRQQVLPFLTQLGAVTGNPALAQSMMPSAWGRPTLDTTLQEIVAMNQMLGPFGGALGPTGITADIGAIQQMSLFGTMLQWLVNALRDLQGATGR